MRRSSRSGGRRRALGVLKHTARSGSGRFPHQPHSQARPCHSTVPSTPGQRKVHVSALVAIDRLAASRLPSTRVERTPRRAPLADSTLVLRRSPRRPFAGGSAPSAPRPTSTPRPTPPSAACRGGRSFTASGWRCSSWSPSAPPGERDAPRRSFISPDSPDGSAPRLRAASAPRPP